MKMKSAERGGELVWVEEEKCGRERYKTDVGRGR